MFVEAYNTVTGKKLPYLVPEHHINHPLLGRNIARLPSQSTAGQDETETSTELVTGLGPDTSTEMPDLITTDTPAAGDEKE